MKNILNKKVAYILIAASAFIGFGTGFNDAHAQLNDGLYYITSASSYYQGSYAGIPNYGNDFLYPNQEGYPYGNYNTFQQYPYYGNSYYGGYQDQYGYSFNDVGSSYGGSSYGGDRPDADTRRADDVDEDSAELNGEVDMNDYRNGIVFFVYGQDEDMIEDVQRDYDTYDDVNDDEEDDDFEVVKVDNDLDDDDRYSEDVRGLEEDEEYFFIICVEYEDEDDDERLECGDVEDFETDDDNSNDEEPEAETRSAQDIQDDSAELNGEVDMNDFSNGLVFFVYGEDEDEVQDVDDEDEYDDIDEEGDDLQKIIVDSDLDGNQSYSRTVYGLDDNTDIYFRICVEYEDEDDDQALECGSVRDFETD